VIQSTNQNSQQRVRASSSKPSSADAHARRALINERVRSPYGAGSISIDDFGTGYSNLGYLKSCPLDQLKIDRSFVKDLPTNGHAVSITRAIVSMGHSLGLRVVAEGVETAAQAQFLSSIWCEHAQGYLYSKLLPAAEFALGLASGRFMETKTVNAAAVN
jgi:sensor c-di-GMP phosphodiesterase-like protein